MKIIHKFALFIILSSLLATGCAVLARTVEPAAPVKDPKTHWMTVATDAQASYPLVRYKVADLGFKEPAILPEIFIAASRHGLDLCPDKLGIPIRTQYGDQPEGEVLYVGMKTVSEGYEGPSIYVVQRSAQGKRSMDAVLVEKDSEFAPSTEFIFVRRKPQ